MNLFEMNNNAVPEQMDKTKSRRLILLIELNNKFAQLWGDIDDMNNPFYYLKRKFIYDMEDVELESLFSFSNNNELLEFLSKKNNLLIEDLQEKINWINSINKERERLIENDMWIRGYLEKKENNMDDMEFPNVDWVDNWKIETKEVKLTDGTVGGWETSLVVGMPENSEVDPITGEIRKPEDCEGCSS